MTNLYGSAEFKSHCLQLIDTVAESGQPIVVTKRGKPVARLVPIEAASAPSAYGYLEGSVRFTDDLLSTGEQWEADQSS